MTPVRLHLGFICAVPVFGCITAMPTVVLAQAAPVVSSETKVKRAAFFDDENPLTFTLTANFGQLRRDTRNDKAPYRPARITYEDGGKQIAVPVGIRPRGIWRRKSCDMPPIRLNFDKDSVRGTFFAKQNRLKLVVTCKNKDDQEQYLLSEFQLYRVYSLLTPLSFKARLARVTYVDLPKGDTISRRYAFLGEEPEDAAKRLGGKPLMFKNASADDMDAYTLALFGVFQYFIGNTDFSVIGLHNVLLLGKDSLFERAYPIARDFDWSGAVNARYAFPDYRLPIKRVTDRLMRGDCAPKETFEEVFNLFRAKKDAIYALYHDSLAAGLKPDVVRETLKYFDDFYSEINDSRTAKRNIISACGPS